MRSTKGQISFEYVMIMGFIMVVIGVIFAAAFYYSDSIKSQIRSSQLTSCSNKIISTAESVFYAGYPSKATIQCYLPDGITDAEIIDDSSATNTNYDLYLEYQSGNGNTTTSFSSNVKLIPHNLNITNGGLKTIVVEARTTGVCIRQIHDDPSEC